jgi:hypothetical protein
VRAIYDWDLDTIEREREERMRDDDKIGKMSNVKMNSMEG